MNKRTNRLQLILRIALFFILPYDDITNLIGDFEELYQNKQLTVGSTKAFCWSAWQVLISAPGFIKDKIYWGTVMFKNYLLSTFRNIKNQKGYSFINIT